MKNTYPKPKKGAWFIKVRGSYLPCSWQGALTYIPMILCLVFIIIAAVHATNSTATIVLLVFPNFVCVGLIMHWLASMKS
jgi:hypothetical protein